jgi:hypothetical protein
MKAAPAREMEQTVAANVAGILGRDGDGTTQLANETP